MSNIINQFLAMLDNFPHHAELKKSLIFIENMQREIKEQNLYLTQLSDEHYINQIVCNYCWRLDKNGDYIVEDQFVTAVMEIVNKMPPEQVHQMRDGLDEGLLF